MDIRRTVFIKEIIATDEMGRPCDPITRVAALAVVRNPFADASLIREVNRTEHVAMLDRNIIGNAISHAAASGISAEEFESYFGRLFSLLLNEISRHPKPLETRLAIAAERKRFK